MKQITCEWITIAVADFATMERESRARKNPNYHAVCFHAQQRAEKYLKARLDRRARTKANTDGHQRTEVTFERIAARQSMYCHRSVESAGKAPHPHILVRDLRLWPVHSWLPDTGV